MNEPIAELTTEELIQYTILETNRNYIQKISLEHNVKGDLFFNQLRLRIGVYDKAFDIKDGKVYVI